MFEEITDHELDEYRSLLNDPNLTKEELQHVREVMNEKEIQMLLGYAVLNRIAKNLCTDGTVYKKLRRKYNDQNSDL